MFIFTPSWGERGTGGWADEEGSHNGKKYEFVNYSGDERQTGMREEMHVLLLMRVKMKDERDEGWLKDITGCNWTAGVK